MRSTKEEVSAAGGGDQFSLLLVGVRRAERHIPLTECVVNIDIEPGGISKFERRCAALRQQRKKLSQARQIFLQKRRQLEQHRAQLGAQHRGCLEHRSQLGSAAQQLFLMGDAARRLHREDEIRWNLLAPIGQLLSFGHAIKRVVDFNGGNPLRIERKHPGARETRGKESPSPGWVAVPARSDSQRHGPHFLANEKIFNGELPRPRRAWFLPDDKSLCSVYKGIWAMPSLEKLLQESIPQLHNRFLVRHQPVPEGLLDALVNDPRNAAQDLARKIQSRRQKNRAEGQRLRNLLRYEVELWRQGVSLVAGVDEAGMAPLAGPVVAAAVILRKEYCLGGLDDSKKILDPAKRELLARQIKQDAICWAVGRAEVEAVEPFNIYHAGLLAMRRAVLGLPQPPDFILVDARKIPDCPSPQRGIIHGDALSSSIAAASIIAKTTRDALMMQMEEQYPGYGFAAHKGYPTPQHCECLKRLGATPIHRRSFAPVRQALGLDPVHEELFHAPDASNPHEALNPEESLA